MSTTRPDAQRQLDALVTGGVQSGTRSPRHLRQPVRDRVAGHEGTPRVRRDRRHVVVSRIDRLGRSMLDVLSTVALLCERGVQTPARTADTPYSPATRPR
ncbi:MAG: recombinase family protein [Clavibacter sp.]|nr:recombinase family protein [Clavibacter sp.]